MRPINKELALICVVLAGISFATLHVSALECIPLAGYEGCACAMNISNTTEVINLLPLKDNSTVPRFTTTGLKNWLFSYNPCLEFSKFVGENATGYTACHNVSAARWTNQSTHECDSLGNQGSAKFNVNTGPKKQYVISNISLTFKSSSAKQYGAVISLVCNKTVLRNESLFRYLGEKNSPFNQYFFSLTSECSCPGLCGIPPAKETPAKNKGKSTEGDDKVKTWVIIVAAVGGFIVLVLLITLIVCCRKRRGYEQV